MILGALAYFGGSELFSVLSAGAQSGDFSFLDEQRFPIIAKILSFAATKWIIGAIFYALASFAVLMLSVFCALLITTFLTPRDFVGRSTTGKRNSWRTWAAIPKRSRQK